MIEAYTPTSARKNLYSIIKNVNEQRKPVMIDAADGNEEKSAVVIGKQDWESIEETLYLVQTGTMEKVQQREKDDSGFTDLNDIDWDEL
ncbi:type II toxin-antitoxin system Phd/YefM family antitoxin [Ligilactobacillus hohenheimensis]|uniref:type II toxin-antitoxin system Phd/YefM family antitoxin n=1 Tax=Ligilactobacillus hohenheimensis TaxID=2991832 RepID=UPI0024BB05CF|nr:type II toxin-antitoxin system Phd/YefM family antitoxin [Ligilactobacillus hohenheimensis]